MTATNTPDLDIPYLQPNSDQPEVVVNAEVLALETKIVGEVSLVMTVSHVLNVTQDQQAGGSIFVLTSLSPGAILPSTVNFAAFKMGNFSFENDTDVPVTVQINGQALPAPTIDAGGIAILKSDGINVRLVTSASATVGGIIKALTADETLAAGDMVNIHNSSGAKMRKANATDATKPCHGFVLNAVTSGQVGIFYGGGQINNKRTGLTPGTTYYLDTTGGAVNSVAPSSGGNVVQELGVALSATELAFIPSRLTLL